MCSSVKSTKETWVSIVGSKICSFKKFFSTEMLTMFSEYNIQEYVMFRNDKTYLDDKIAIRRFWGTHTNI